VDPLFAPHLALQVVHQVDPLQCHHLGLQVDLLLDQTELPVEEYFSPHQAFNSLQFTVLDGIICVLRQSVCQSVRPGRKDNLLHFE